MAEATVKLGMDTRGFDKGAQQATTTIGDISAFAAAKFAAMQAIVGRAMDAASQLIEAGMKRLTEEVLNAKREAEGLAMLSKRLEGVYGSAEKASKGMREIAAVSERLSITTQDASSLGATLADAGVPAKQLASAVRVLADVSAGSGKTMESLGKIYADVYKRGALSAEEFNTLTAAGIPIQQQLSKQLFGGFEGAGDQARKGKVSADEFVRALQRMSTVTRGSGNLSIYAGASGVVLDSFDGKLRKIGETLRGFLVSLVGLFVKVDDGANRAATPLERIKNALKPVADAVLQSLQAVRPFVDQVVARFRLLMDFLSQGPDLAEQIAGKLKEGVTSLGFLERLPGYAREFGKQISDTVGFLTTAFQQGILWEIAGLRLQAAFADAVNALAVGISKAIVQSTAAVTDFISPVLSTVSAAIGSAIEVLTDKQTFIQLGEYLISTFDLATNYLKDAMTRAVDAIKNLFLNEVVPSILGGFDYLVAKLKSKAGLTGGNASLGAYIFANKAPI
ncbi:MAG: hypothetical protein RLZZ244_1855, partial [Verrucomicrobiota bacterium]